MKKYEYIVLLFLCLILYYHHHNDKPKCPDGVCPIKPVVVNPITPNKPIVPPTPAPDNPVIEKPCLIIFTAKWCSHCRALKRDFSNLDTNAYEICFIDIDDRSKKEWIKKFNITSLPTSIILSRKDLSEIKRITGYNFDEYKKWLKV